MNVNILNAILNTGAKIELTQEPREKRDYITLIWPEGTIAIDVSYLEKHQAMSLDGVEELVGRKLLKEIIKQCRENLSRNVCNTASDQPMPVAGVLPAISASGVQ